MLHDHRQEDDQTSKHPQQHNENVIQPVFPVVHKISKSVEALIEKNQALSTIIAKKEQELKELKAQLLQAGKLATLGTLGASVAHELNNPLTVVAAEADDLLDSTDLRPEAIRHSATNIKACAKRMQEIVNYIRCYARDDKKAKWTKINPNQIIQSALLLLQRQLDEAGILVKLKLDNDLPDIWGHANQLESVLQNLITNGRDALLASSHNEPKQILITTTCSDVNTIQITVSDNGCGMSSETKAQLFKPFFTTKPAGKGTGLGMAIALGIIAEHNGDIRVYSRENVGTKFTITFPLDRRTIVSGKQNAR